MPRRQRADQLTSRPRRMKPASSAARTCSPTGGVLADERSAALGRQHASGALANAARIRPSSIPANVSRSRRCRKICVHVNRLPMRALSALATLTASTVPQRRGRDDRRAPHHRERRECHAAASRSSAGAVMIPTSDCAIPDQHRSAGSVSRSIAASSARLCSVRLRSRCRDRHRFAPGRFPPRRTAATRPPEPAHLPTTSS